MPSNDELVEVEVFYHKETDKAMLVSTVDDESSAVWVPKSQVEVTQYGLTMPRWLAKKSDFI